MATPPIIGLPQPSLFTLAPSHFAGRRALKGFEFQTAYIAYVLSGFAAGKEDFVSCRVEAVEDLDALVKVQDTWIERYYQIKSKQEGSGRWTLNLLDREGVLEGFFKLFRKFRLQSSRQNRRIEFVVAVDGELDIDLVQIREEGVKADSRIKLFAILCSREVISRDGSLEPFANVIRDWCEENANVLIAESTTSGSESGQRKRALGALATRIATPAGVIGPRLMDSAGEIDSLLDEFVSSLRFDSRVGSLLNEATFGRLIEAGDLSPDEARAAFDRLKRSVEVESALSTPTAIDHSILREWLGIPKRIRLQTKPNPDAHAVSRRELLEEVSGILQTNCFVLLYGLSKIGKSQFVAALIDHGDKGEHYFWYAFSGDAGDLNRLTRQLAIWVGEKLGAWQIADDLETAALPPLQAFERLGHCLVRDTYIVLDDCHKTTDNLAFELLCKLTSQGWSGCHLILVSERKIPAASALGAREKSLPGLSPAESVVFVKKLGLDPTNSLVQIAMLSVQVGGHPVMLRAAVSELPPKPSPEEVIALSQRIPSFGSAEAFLSDLSNRIFFGLLRTQDQRVWLARIAAVGFPVTQDLALQLAERPPNLQILGADWIYLKSLLLDETSADHYSVPILLRQIAETSISMAERRSLQVSAARHVFHAAIASRNVDIWDFQHALFALLGAECYEEAGIRFVHSFRSLLRMNSFEPLELLFMAMNSEPMHTKIADPATCWLMLQFEVQLRVLDESSLDRSRVRDLIRRMRGAQTSSYIHYARPMLHLAIASVRMREQRDLSVSTERDRQRMFAPLHSALREALTLADVDFLANILSLYDHLHAFVPRPNVELLKAALLQLPKHLLLPISVHALIGVYSKYVSSLHHSDAALQLVESHSELFRAAGRGDAHFACEYAAATILHDGRRSYRLARERLEPLVSRAPDLHLSPHSVDHGLMFIADTYWAECKYIESAEYYQMVLHEDLGSSGLHQITCERLCDSLIFLKKYEDAVRIVLADLRSRRADQAPEQRARLYARLVYAYAERGALKRAAISCLGLGRIAAQSSSDALDLLGATMAGWVLGHFTYSDPGIPDSNTNMVRDSNALSDAISSEEQRKWRDADPFRTRRMVLTATLFELLEDWRRSEYLYRRALGTVLGSDRDTKSFREVAGVYLLRLARIHIRVGKLEEAAYELKQALEYVMDVARQDTPRFARAGAGAYVHLKMADLQLRACSDQDLIRFFGLLKSQFASDITVQAWVCYRESEILFERLAVQSAKRRLGEAMDLAGLSSEFDLYWLVVRDKLFSRIQQMYGRQEDWLRDVLEVTVALARDENFAVYRRSFAESVVQAVGTATQGPFLLVAAVVKRLGGHWQEQAFLVAAYAIWCAATSARVISSSRIAVESMLRAEAAFLGRSDFD